MDLSGPGIDVKLKERKKEVKSTMLGWFILMEVMHLPEKGVKMLLRKATKKSPWMP